MSNHDCAPSDHNSAALGWREPAGSPGRSRSWSASAGAMSEGGGPVASGGPEQTAFMNTEAVGLSAVQSGLGISGPGQRLGLQPVCMAWALHSCSRAEPSPVPAAAEQGPRGSQGQPSPGRSRQARSSTSSTSPSGACSPPASHPVSIWQPGALLRTQTGQRCLGARSDPWSGVHRRQSISLSPPSL